MLYEAETYNLDKVPSFQAKCHAAREASTVIMKDLSKEIYRCLNVVNVTNDLFLIEKMAIEWRQKFDDVVIIGTGGSSLGAAAITALKSNFQGVCTPHYLDNLDTLALKNLADSVDFSKTGFLVISKSGVTVEVISQMLVMLDILEQKVGQKDLTSQVVVITINDSNTIRNLALEKGCVVFDCDKNISGRYSIFSNVAAMPAILAGCDMKEMRKGAKIVLKNFSEAESLPLLGAAWMAALIDQGFFLNILVPYDPRLVLFSQWHRQLWAESLGKNGQGMTPAPALGPVDQHSQLQLWLDGPQDKVFTFIVLDTFDRTLKINTNGVKEIRYLEGKSIGDVVSASARATIEALISKGCPLRVIRVHSLSDYSLGALFMHFLLETIVTARLLGIDPFNQPSVDKVKTLVRKYIS